MVFKMEKNKKILVETLTRGRNSALRLQNLLRRKQNDDGSVSVDDLLKEISGSLFDGLSMLNSSGEVQVGLGCSVNRSPEVFTGDIGKIPPPASEKKGRGRYKRRRGIDSRIVLSDTIADDYEWRKYGQKEILNSQFPRCYFRCTHKDGHGCKALKQVQRLEEEESNKFHITYFGHHTCPTPHVVSHHGPGLLLDFEGFRNHGNLPNTPSTIKKIHIDTSRKQNDPSNKKVSSSPSLVSMERLTDDLDHHDKAPRFNDQDSCPTNITDSFENGDFLGDISVDDMLSMVKSYWGEYNQI